MYVFQSRLELSDNDSSTDSGDSIHQQQEQMEDQEPQEQQEPDLQDATQETDNTPEVSTGCPKEGSSSDSDEDPALRSIYQKETITASSKSQQFSVFKVIFLQGYTYLLCNLSLILFIYLFRVV